MIVVKTLGVAPRATRPLEATEGEEVELAGVLVTDEALWHVGRSVTQVRGLPPMSSAGADAMNGAPKFAAYAGTVAFANICLMPRRACRVRSSFSMREKRTWLSPWSPKPMPGLTATLASVSSNFENSSEPKCR
jgi:hypothetical protein